MNSNLNEEGKPTSSLALFVMSCDAYTNIAQDFFRILLSKWDNCHIHAYLITENCDVNIEYGNTTIIKTGEILEWSDRCAYALNKVKENYVLFMLDDYFIGKKINQHEIDATVSIVEKEYIQYYQLEKYYRLNMKRHNEKKVKGIEYVEVIPENATHGMSLGPAIWETKYFLSLIADLHCSAWEVESKMISYVDYDSKKARENWATDTRNLLDRHEGIVQGKWFKRTIDFYASEGICIETKGRAYVSEKELRRRRISGKLGMICTGKMRVQMKKFLSKLGAKFISKQ